MGAGSLKLTRKQLEIITGGDARAIREFEEFFAALNSLGLHAPSHEPGGSDPLIHGVHHVTGGGDTIPNAIAGGASGLMSGLDKTNLNSVIPYVDTAANLAALNPVMAPGQLGWETDTLSGKIGDGSTAYNSLEYFYRGLPVAGESSLGTPHPTSDADRTATLVVNTSTNTAGVWSAAVTMTGVPTGAKAAWCYCEIIKAADRPRLCVEAATGYTLSDITSGTNYSKYMCIGRAPVGEYMGCVMKIHLDSNKQFKWCTSVTNSTVQISSAIDYEM